MPPSLHKMCRCDICKVYSPDGREVSSQMFARHKKAQALADSEQALAVAQRQIAAQTISQAAPGLSTLNFNLNPSMQGIESTGRPIEHGGRWTTGDTSSGEPVRNNSICHLSLTVFCPPARSRILQDIESSLDGLHLSLISELTCAPQPTILHFLDDPMAEDGGIWDQIFAELRSSPFPQLFRRHFILTEHSDNHTFLRYETRIYQSLRQLHDQLSLAGHHCPDSTHLFQHGKEIQKMLSDALSDAMVLKQEIWRSQRQLRERNLPLPTSLSDRPQVNTGARIALKNILSFSKYALQLDS